MGFVEDQKNATIHFYYCTKNVYFPLTDVIKKIYYFYEQQNANSLEFNKILNFLKEKYDVKSFNRQNLHALLESYDQVPFINIKDLCFKYDVFYNKNNLLQNIEQKELTLKNEILILIKQVNKNNDNARIKYLMPTFYSLLEKHNIFLIKDIEFITDELVNTCYVYKDVFLKILKRLISISIPDYLNEKFKYLLQLANEDYKPNTLWGNYVSILEKRAEDLTLEKSGEDIGVTRERVRQLEKKYLARFTAFYNSNILLFNNLGNESLSNIIRAFCDDPLFIQDQDIAKIFSFNPKIFKYLLKNAEINDVQFIEELDKFYFVDDYDWYKELLIYKETIPDSFSYSQVDIYVNKAQQILQKNDVNLSYEDCKKILFQDYKLIGTLYSKTNLNLSEKFKTIIKRFYPNPINIYDPNFIEEFRKHYYDIYKDDKLKTDHAISNLLSKIGILVSRGSYILNDRTFMSKDLADKIYKYIIESKRDIFLSNNLFSIFKEDLINEGINNKYFMQGALKQHFSDKLFFRKDYISATNENVSIYNEIAQFIKGSERIVSYDELCHEFPGTPWNVLILGTQQDGILNYRAKYLHVDLLHLSDQDIFTLKECVTKLVSDNAIHHVDDLLSYLKIKNNNLLNKLLIQDQFGLYSLLEYLFIDQFEFKRPFIANLGIKIEKQSDRLKEFINSADELSIDSIMDFAYDNKITCMRSIIDFIDSLDNYIFKDNYTIIKINKTNLNKYNTEIVENMICTAMGSNEFVYADNLPFYKMMPKEVAWTPWLLYSALNKFGTKLKAIPSETKFRVKKRLIIINKNISVTNIDEYIEYLKNKMNLNDVEFYKFLKTKGLIY